MEEKKGNYQQAKLLCDWCQEKEYSISIYDNDLSEVLLCSGCYANEKERLMSDESQRLDRTPLMPAKQHKTKTI